MHASVFIRLWSAPTPKKRPGKRFSAASVVAPVQSDLFSTFFCHKCLSACRNGRFCSQFKTSRNVNIFDKHRCNAVAVKPPPNGPKQRTSSAKYALVSSVFGEDPRSVFSFCFVLFCFLFVYVVSFVKYRYMEMILCFFYRLKMVMKGIIQVKGVVRRLKTKSCRSMSFTQSS